MNLLNLVDKIVKVVLLILHRYKFTPLHKRKSSLNDLNNAIDKTYVDNDTGDLERWFKNDED